ncbi:MAG: nucleotide exchange factor GrpE [Acholeplasmatales bacterium]|nr:nucleotide exchange factor GrpE [Acholeplasmatales bacterium]
MEENKKEVKEEIKDEALAEEEVKETESKEEAKKEEKKEKKNKDKEKIAKLEADYAELKNEYLKVYAEMENTKRRINEQAIKDRKYASQKVVGELINPIDMLIKIVNMPSENPEVKNYQIGFQMIANQLLDVLKAEGLAHIESLGKEFDPKVMQAVETCESDEDNKVLKVMQEGYMYKDRVLRPAMVVVGKKKQEVKEENKEEVM